MTEHDALSQVIPDLLSIRKRIRPGSPPLDPLLTCTIRGLLNAFVVEGFDVDFVISHSTTGKAGRVTVTGDRFHDALKKIAKALEPDKL